MSLAHMVHSTEDLTEIARASGERTRRNFGRRIRFYTPSFMPYRNRYSKQKTREFPSISITGRDCALRCKHCCGRLLQTMIPANSPAELAEILRGLHEKNAAGCLISGGCGLDGGVPLAPFLDTIAKAKRAFGLKMVVHTGIVDQALAERLGKVGIDAALIDVIGSDETIKEIYRLRLTTEDYEKSLGALEKARIPTVPHILVGLHYGALKGEFKALEIVARHNPSAVIVIGLAPIRNTPMADCRAASSSDIVSVIARARSLMPQTPIALGCARPKGRLRERIDMLAVQAGVNGIAYPHPRAIELANSLSLKCDFSNICCSQVYEDFKSVESN